MRLMIANSHNVAATQMTDRIGLDKMAEVMQDPEYDFYDQATGGGLWVSKRYAKKGARKGDLLKIAMELRQRRGLDSITYWLSVNW
jgi:beta-lactamase class A